MEIFSCNRGHPFWIWLPYPGRIVKSKATTLGLKLLGLGGMVFVFFSEEDPPMWFFLFVIAILVDALMAYYKSPTQIENK